MPSLIKTLPGVGLLTAKRSEIRNERLRGHHKSFVVASLIARLLVFSFLPCSVARGLSTFTILTSRHTNQQTAHSVGSASLKAQLFSTKRRKRDAKTRIHPYRAIRFG